MLKWTCWTCDWQQVGCWWYSQCSITSFCMKPSYCVNDMNIKVRGERFSQQGYSCSDTWSSKPYLLPILTTVLHDRTAPGLTAPVFLLHVLTLWNNRETLPWVRFNTWRQNTFWDVVLHSVWTALNQDYIDQDDRAVTLNSPLKGWWERRTLTMFTWIFCLWENESGYRYSNTETTNNNFIFPMTIACSQTFTTNSPDNAVNGVQCCEQIWAMELILLRQLYLVHVDGIK